MLPVNRYGSCTQSKVSEIRPTSLLAGQGRYPLRPCLTRERPRSVLRSFVGTAFAVPLYQLLQRYNPDHRGHFSSLRKILISSSGDSANFRFANSTSPSRLDFLRLDFRRSTSPPSRILDVSSTLYTENRRSISRISPTIFPRAIVSMWIKTAKTVPFVNMFNYQMFMNSKTMVLGK